MQPSHEGVEWRQGALPDAAGEGAGFDAIISCGPLDLFSRWYADTPTGAARVVAFGSTSVHVKGDSPDAAERGRILTSLLAMGGEVGKGERPQRIN